MLFKNVGILRDSQKVLLVVKDSLVVWSFRMIGEDNRVIDVEVEESDIMDLVNILRSSCELEHVVVADSTFVEVYRIPFNGRQLHVYPELDSEEVVEDE